MRKLMFAVTVAIGLLQLSAGVVEATVVTGTYDPMPGGFGVTTGTGPWTLTSTDASFSLLRFTNNESFKFSELTSLSVDFNSPVLNAQTPFPQALLNAGGGGGAPRLSVAVDTDNDNLVDGGILIHLGTSPNFIDAPLSLNLHSNENVLNNDAGRYDLSQFGGSNFTNYATALSLVGNASVKRITVILDSFGGADKTLEVSSIDAQFTAIPEPSAMLFGGIVCSAVSAICAIRRLRGGAVDV